MEGEQTGGAEDNFTMVNCGIQNQKPQVSKSPTINETSGTQPCFCKLLLYNDMDK
jgi:hypothetical protein